MVTPNSLVLMDTNAIIEAHRIDCWKLLAGHYRMGTVEKCIEECATGNQRTYNPVEIDTKALKKDLNPKKILEKDIIELYFRCADSKYLDDGEKYLLAYAIMVQDAFLICSPDKMCMRIGNNLGILDSFVSLEELVQQAGKHLIFNIQFTKKWLENFRTVLKLENL